jgi:hypothetical protein
LARIRYLKPDFFKDEDLAEFPYWIRLLYCGLWTIADREGRLEDRPQRIKVEIFPYEKKQMDIEKGLELLAKPKKYSGKPFILRYRIGCDRYIQILNWHKHQKPHSKESPSEIPSPNGYLTINENYPNEKTRKEVYERDDYICQYCGLDLKNESRKICLDHLIPLSKNGSNSKKNLVTSCKKCNAKKLNKTPEEVGMKRPKGLGELVKQCTVNGGLTVCHMENGEWGMENGKGNGERGMENGKGKSPKGDSLTSEAKPISEREEILLKWNDFAEKHGLASIQTIRKGSTREKLLRARMSEKDFNFDFLLEMIANSPFLLGKSKEPFFVTFDWIIKPSNYQKIVEGNYLQRRGQGKFVTGGDW